MAGKNDDVINVGVCQCLIQMVPHDFESALVLKEGGGNHEAVVAVKQKKPQAIFCGKTVFCGEAVLTNCALPIRKVTADLSIEILQNKHHITGKDGNNQV
jgi:hypothetical protein